MGAHPLLDTILEARERIIDDILTPVRETVQGLYPSKAKNTTAKSLISAEKATTALAIIQKELGAVGLWPIPYTSDIIMSPRELARSVNVAGGACIEGLAHPTLSATERTEIYFLYSHNRELVYNPSLNEISFMKAQQKLLGLSKNSSVGENTGAYWKDLAYPA